MSILRGVAPFNPDRGTLRGTHTVWGGRARVRTPRYLGTLAAIRFNPVIRAFYPRLLNAGQLLKVALTAGMRKLLTILNARTNHRTPWRYEVGS